MIEVEERRMTPQTYRWPNVQALSCSFPGTDFQRDDPGWCNPQLPKVLNTIVIVNKD